MEEKIRQIWKLPLEEVWKPTEDPVQDTNRSNSLTLQEDSDPEEKDKKEEVNLPRSLSPVQDIQP